MQELVRYLLENLYLDFQGDISVNRVREFLREDDSREARALLSKIIEEKGVERPTFGPGGLPQGATSQRHYGENDTRATFGLHRKLSSSALMFRRVSLGLYAARLVADERFVRAQVHRDNRATTCLIRMSTDTTLKDRFVSEICPSPWPPTTTHLTLNEIWPTKKLTVGGALRSCPIESTGTSIVRLCFSQNCSCSGLSSRQSSRCSGLMRLMVSR